MKRSPHEERDAERFLEGGFLQSPILSAENADFLFSGNAHSLFGRICFLSDSARCKKELYGIASSTKRKD